MAKENTRARNYNSHDISAQSADYDYRLDGIRMSQSMSFSADVFGARQEPKFALRATCLHRDPEMHTA